MPGDGWQETWHFSTHLALLSPFLRFLWVLYSVFDSLQSCRQPGGREAVLSNLVHSSSCPPTAPPAAVFLVVRLCELF